ncbi:MAG: 50S ribosomal protein L21e [Candidatus Aenigmarchaeota archaeon]|nr:50S ribosomal protein L21e [Candidatus Aenigmarchaeota archaeon]
MVVKSKGPHRRTRRILKRKLREKFTVNRFLQQFPVGTKVMIDLVPGQPKGRPFKRFIGKTGVVIDKRGESYIIKIKDGGKEKQIISRPEHLKQI